MEVVTETVPGAMIFTRFDAYWTRYRARMDRELRGQLAWLHCCPMNLRIQR